MELETRPYFGRSDWLAAGAAAGVAMLAVLIGWGLTLALGHLIATWDDAPAR